MDDANPNTQEARLLIAGGFYDFLIYLVALPNPIVVGGGYPRNKIYEAFRDWANSVGFDAIEANPHLWREACRHGFFRRG
ncbi:MAG: hypothetical protein WC315_00040 [Candidatus Omnitrophota bacterium]|jgi:hypothetical protein